MTVELDDPAFAPGVVESVLARPWPVVASTIIGLVAALALTIGLLPERYTASATATIADPNRAAFTSGGAITADYERYLESVAGFAESRRVAEAAAEALDDVDAEDLAEQTTVSSDVAGRTLSVTVSGDDPAIAAERANAILEAFDTQHRTHLAEQTERTIAALDEQVEQVEAEVADARSLQVSTGDQPSELDDSTVLLDSLRERRAELSVNAAAYGSGVEFMEPAEAPPSPSSPNKMINGAVGLLLGALAGMAFVWIRADRRRPVSSSESPQVLIELPLLGKVPEYPSSTEALADPTAMPVTEYQFVASALRAHLAPDAGVVLVGGVGRDVGTTVTVANLAVAAARADLTVAVIDACDDEGLGSIFGQRPMQAGLLDLLSSRDGSIDRQRLTWALGPVSVGARSVRLLSLGTSSRSTMASQLRSRVAGRLFDELRSRFDFVIVDCGSVLNSPTAGALVRSADAMALVIRNGTPSDMVIEARERLAVERAPLVGYVYSRANRSERRRFRSVNLGDLRANRQSADPFQALAPAPLTVALPHATGPDRPGPSGDDAPASRLTEDGPTPTPLNGVTAWPMPSADAAATGVTEWGSTN